MTASTTPQRIHPREYNIAYDGNPKPSTHPQTDCWDFAYPGGITPSVQQRTSCQAKTPVFLEAEMDSPVLGSAGTGDVEEKTLEKDALDNHEEVGLSESVTHRKCIPGDAHQKCDCQRPGDKGGEIRNGNKALKQEDSTGVPEKGMQQGGMRAWIMSFFFSQS